MTSNNDNASDCGMVFEHAINLKCQSDAEHYAVSQGQIGSS